MLAAPSRAWNVFKQIFADHWEPFQRAHPRYQTAYYDGLVAKMLECGTPEKMDQRAHLHRNIRFCITSYQTIVCTAI